MAFSDVLQTLGRVIGLFPGDNLEDDPRGGAVYNDYMPEDSYQEQPEESSYDGSVYESGYGDSGAYGRAGARLKPQPRRNARAAGRERAQQQEYSPRQAQSERAQQRPSNVIDMPEREPAYDVPPPQPQQDQPASAVIFCVRRIDDAMEIIDCLMNGQNVILNFEDVDDLLFRRVIDMVSGASFVLNGEVGRISRRIYLVVPNGMRITRSEANARASRNAGQQPHSEAAGYGAW